MNSGGVAFEVTESQHGLERRERFSIWGAPLILLALPIVFPATYLVARATGLLGLWSIEGSEDLAILALPLALAITWANTRGRSTGRRLALHAAAFVVGPVLWWSAHYGWAFGGWVFAAPVIPFGEFVEAFSWLAYVSYALWGVGSILAAIAVWPARPGTPLPEDHVRLLGGAAVGLATVGVIIIATSLLPAALSDGILMTLVGAFQVMIAVVCLALCSKLLDPPTIRRNSLVAMAWILPLLLLFVLVGDPQDWTEYVDIFWGPLTIMTPFTFGFFAAHAIVGATLVALTPQFEGDDARRQRLRYLGGAALFLLAAVLLVAAGENAAGVAGRLLA